MECIGNMSNKELWSGRYPSQISKLKVSDFSEDGEIIPEDLVGLILDLEDDRALKFDRHQVCRLKKILTTLRNTILLC